MNAASAGGGADTIDVPAGTYQLSASFGALVVDAGMTITGAGARTTTILAPPRDRVLDVTAAATPVAIDGLHAQRRHGGRRATAASAATSAAPAT